MVVEVNMFMGVNNTMVVNKAKAATGNNNAKVVDKTKVVAISDHPRGQKHQGIEVHQKRNQDLEGPHISSGQ